jgi:adenine-specific DNA-methyltransferase
MHSASAADTQRARELRTAMTDAEVRLWCRLRAGQMAGHRFRRQYPIGPYIVDFVCLEARLVIEVDGGQHSEQTGYDDRRTAWLEERGFRVLRLWNHYVLEENDGVWETIVQALSAPEQGRE